MENGGWSMEAGGWRLEVRAVSPCQPELEGKPWTGLRRPLPNIHCSMPTARYLPGRRIRYIGSW